MGISKYEPRIEVNHKVIIDNLHQIKNRLDVRVKIMGVVKADAYGHGVGEVAKTLESSVEMFGVGNLNEATELGEWVDKDIFIMGPMHEFNYVNKEKFILTIESSIQFQCLLKYIELNYENRDSEAQEAINSDSNKQSQLLHPIRVHLKVNTGMSRFGLTKEELQECLEHLSFNNRSSHIAVEGMYSHFASTIVSDKKLVDKQYELFCSMKRTIEKFIPREKLIYHIANSENAIDDKTYQEDMVRIGNGLYGPLALKNPIKLRKAARVLLPVISIHEIAEAGPIGYGSKKHVKSGTKVGVVQAGFSDGFGLTKTPVGQSGLKIILYYAKRCFKALFSPEKVFFSRETFNILGSVNMQFFQINVTGSTIMIGDFVEVKQAPLYFKSTVKRLHISEDKDGIN